jgi:hypothetical protein
MPQVPGELTLRDRVVVSIRSDRELIEHLEQAFIPKVHALRKLTRGERQADAAPPGDRTVHAAAAAVLEADNFTVGVYERLIAHCESIRTAVEELTGNKP